MNKKMAAARRLVGKNIYAINKKGAVITGKLLKISANTLYVQVKRRHKGTKKVHTSAILPLVLFDLLAVGGASPYGYGAGPYGFGGGFGPGLGGGGLGGYPPGYGGFPGGGYPGLF